MIFGFTVAAAVGVVPVFAAIPANLALPLPASPFLSLPGSEPVEFLASETVPVAKNLHLEIAQGSLNQPLHLPQTFVLATAEQSQLTAAAPQRRTGAAALDWDFSKWGSLGVAVESGVGSPTLLGDFTPKPLAFTDTAATSAAGLSAHVKLGDGWVTSFSYGMDARQLDLRAGSVAALAERSAHGESYGVSVAKHGLFGNSDALGLSVTRPSDEFFGGVSLADAGLESGANLATDYRGFSLGNAKETDVALGYVTTFFNGALSLQANAGYQINAGGQNGANAVTVLSRAKINF